MFKYLAAALAAGKLFGKVKIPWFVIFLIYLLPIGVAIAFWIKVFASVE